nr:MAG TPA: hypothetical protein [Caudoviricetes sp.]
MTAKIQKKSKGQLWKIIFLPSVYCRLTTVYCRLTPNP